MTLFRTWILTVLLASAAGSARAQLQIVPDSQPQAVFGGDARKVSIIWHNDGSQAASAEIQARVLQTSSATVVQLAEAPWKNLQVLPEQTVLESATLDFPAVKGETKFLVQWLEGTNHVFGTTEVRVYPTNLLAELKPLAGDEAPGVFDPLDQLKPLLKNLKLDFTDLEDIGLENFSGKLAIVGPFQSQAQVPDDLKEQIKALAKRNVAVVWLQPPPDRRDKLMPSFYSVIEGTNAVVVAQSDLLSGLPENPQSQLDLVYFCKLALNPQPLTLPALTPQP